MDTLDRLLAELGTVEPPHHLVQRVMTRIGSTRGGRWNALLAARRGNPPPLEKTPGPEVLLDERGRARTPSPHRNAWLGLAAAAMIAIGVFAIRGYSPTPGGVEATVGVATRRQVRPASVAENAASTSRAFHELHLGGEPNAAGFAVVGVRKGRTPYELEVKGSTVVARPGIEGAPTLSGAALVGLVFDLRDAAAGESYALEIAGSGSTPYWAGAPEAATTYALTYTSAQQPEPRPLCTTGANEAILFGGDRYDAARKTVTATGEATRGWLNVACAGTALVKLFLTRHTEASQTVPTTRAQRQAMLKMFTADVCGDGTTFTIHGQPLLWADANGLTTFARSPASFEAAWSERGAVCLDTPRRLELAASIEEHCPRPPRCPDPAAARALGYVISANPHSQEAER